MLKAAQIMFEGGGSLMLKIDSKNILPLKDLLDKAVDTLVDITGFADGQDADSPVMLRPSKVCCLSILEIPRIQLEIPRIQSVSSPVLRR